MNVYLFTGEADLPSGGPAIVLEAMRALPAPAVCVYGGARGVDTCALQNGLALWPSARHVVCYPAASWNSALRPAGVEFLPAPSGSSPSASYMLRNDLMVATARAAGGEVTVVAFPAGAAEVLRSGTWATVRRGRAAGFRELLRPLG